MTDKEIKAEIKGIYDKIDLCIGELVKGRATHNETLVVNAQHKMESLIVQAQQVLSCISDAIEEEPVSEDLEEAARKAATWNSHIAGDKFFPNDYWLFKKGAQWQKEQMMKDAIDGEITDDVLSKHLRYDAGKFLEAWDKFNIGDKVKLIVIKED